MSIKISHSQKDKYLSCPRKWYYHYKQKLRSPKVGSALFFGNALDDAFSRMLLEKKKDLSPAEKSGLELSPEEIFSSGMLKAKNDAGQIIEVPQSNLADYYTSDFDASLFTPEMVKLVSQMDQNINTIQKIVTFHENCKSNLNWRNKNKRRLTDDEFVLYNYINWLSLNEKGKLMLKAYKSDIIPKIAEVHSIQKEVEIKSDLNDVICGKIDYIASFTDRPDVPVIMDNKSSSKAYSKNAVKESDQLATYAEAEQNFNCGYSVILKEVFKKEPKIHTQIIIDTIPDSQIEKTFDIFANVCETIEAAGDDISNYPKNESSCFAFGKTCPYYGLCKYNNSEHLIDCKPKDDKK